MMFLSLLAFTGAFTLSSSAVVDTSYGKVSGTTSPFRKDVEVFKGIPFAAPPVGDLRWAPPILPKKWNVTLNATSFGAECPQMASAANQTGFISPLEPDANVTISEDCLFLNVWTPTPAKGENLAGRKLPVYLWYYGGRFEGGSGGVIAYDGSGLAIKDIVVVTMNYRLGAFGFLAHPQLMAESPHNSTGNYAVMDMQAALRWVKDEISAFGGDPNHITTGGQSSGSSCSLDMMFSPLSSDLIVGTIAESGARAPRDPLTESLATSYRNYSEALANGEKVMKSFNLTTIEEMRKLTVAELVKIGNANGDDFEGTQFENVSNFMEPPEWRPVLDGYVFEYTVSEYGRALLNNKHGDVNILTGNNADESGASPSPGLTVSSYKRQFKDCFEPQDLTKRFFDLYPGDTTDEANNNSNKFWRDLSRESSWIWAKEWREGGSTKNVYTYYWDHAPPSYISQGEGAFHGSELYYVFNNIPYANYNANWAKADYDIARVMSEYWANFIKTGNPNGGNLTEWEASSDNKATMRLGSSFKAISTASQESIELIQDWFSQLHEY